MQEKTIIQFTDELSSKAHVPGGGAVAALNGACAASLISMVINLTTGKEDFAQHEEELGKNLASAVEARDFFLGGMQRDADAFDSVMACYKLPKSTKDEKKARKAKMQAAFKAAATEPMKAMILGRALLDTIERLVEITNPNLVSDLGLAAINACASSRGALLNVEINLGFIKDEEFVANAKSEIERTQSGINEVLENALAKVKAVMAG